MTCTNSNIPLFPKPTIYNFIDLEGRIFGRLTVCGYVGRSKDKASLWLCQCTCGNRLVTRYNQLKRGDTKSCGCWHAEARRTHGQSGTPTYHAWDSMLRRCKNKRNPRYVHYGGRGIAVCKRWETFEHFFADMGERPSAKHSLDRIDNNGNYDPGNCRWATISEQNTNYRRNHYVTWKGKNQTISMWAEELHFHQSVLGARLRNGWTVDRAFTEPVHKTKASK